jgi:chromosomal replication initiation ATPase DnaA
MKAQPRQLALALTHPESFTREDFLPGTSNAASLRLIEAWPDWPGRMLLLVGPEGSGKSHLASIWADASGARLVAAHALQEGRVPATLGTGAVVVEDMAPGRFDERALLHLLNLARETGCFALFTARSAPSGWTLAITDLASRLRALPSVAVKAPDDHLLRALLVKLFTDRQIAVDEPLIGYLVSRIERSFAAARNVVRQLDTEALRRKRPLTKTLAAEILRSP